ncbi:MAG: type VI secretion system-associated protein TagF [Zoogloeaceae bacterium]|nr:type VI secretion system-associated protein TagF [Zoogloeaceae bacterium]
MFSRSKWQLAGTVALWGKMPSHGDFIRRNLPFEREEALEEWVRQKRDILSPQEKVSRRKVTQGIPWSSLELPTGQAPSADTLTFGYPSQPWCFVLPPQSPPFAVDHYLMGVWMDSSDKVGREYPLIMIQTVTRRWIGQYFALHAEQPREWLFRAARLIADSIHVQEYGARHSGAGEVVDDHAALLQAKLNALWSLYAPNWRNFLGKRISLPDGDARRIQELMGAPHPDDPIRHLDGVRFLPWADWPRCMLDFRNEGYFWQQNLHGRFIGAIRA